MDTAGIDKSDASSGVSETSRDLSGARDLVIRAYALALAGGREDWRRMSIAVLKNRLLDMTDRGFAERQWDVSTMGQFVELLNDVLTLDTSTKPPTAVLHDDVDVDAALPIARSESARRGGGWRIRRDLWDAVMDFDGDTVYLWNGHMAVACPPGETQKDPASVLPTLTAAEFADWRRQYADDLMRGALAEPARDQIEAWRDAAASSQLLPAYLRSRWSGALKHHVRARLEEWFAKRAEEPPRDLVTAAGRSIGARDNTEKLRALVVSAVERMTRSELEGLSLPVSVLVNLLK